MSENEDLTEVIHRMNNGAGLLIKRLEDLQVQLNGMTEATQKLIEKCKTLNEIPNQIELDLNDKHNRD